MKYPFNLFISICLLLFTHIGCTNSKDRVRNNDIVIDKEDVRRFKNDLESLNEKNKIFVNVNDSSRIVYSTEEDILQLQNGIVLFGWPSCPWLRNAVEPLLEFSEEEHAAIYYLDIKTIRDKKELKDGKVITTEEGSKGYTAILQKFGDILNPYKGLDVDSIKRISSPTVLFIQDGKAVYKVVSTVVSQTDPHIKLNEAQRKELKQRYHAFFADNKI